MIYKVKSSGVKQIGEDYSIESHFIAVKVGMNLQSFLSCYKLQTGS